MSRRSHIVALAAMFALVSVSVILAQQQPSRVSDQQIGNLLKRMDAGVAAGAGTVIVHGRDQLDLPHGTELTIISSLRSGQRASTSRQR